MSSAVEVKAQEVRATSGAPSRQPAASSPWPRHRVAFWVAPAWRWDRALAVGAIAAAAVAVWLTLRAGFLAHPGWLAAQKADFILGPIGVGLYWHYRRPTNRLGLMLIVLGLLGIPYILESTTSPWPFTVGSLMEPVIEWVTFAAILAFPSGRLDGVPERVLLAAFLVGVSVPWATVALTGFGPSFSISGCRALCPSDPFVVWPRASWATPLIDAIRAVEIPILLGAIGLFVWRFVTGTPPRRRALAIGAPIAVCFLTVNLLYQLLQLIDQQYDGATSSPIAGPIDWTLAASRAAIWYGFLFALIAAELFAGRALRGLVGESLGRPSVRVLQGKLRRPLGDPGLRLGFWEAGSSGFASADGRALEPPGPDQTLTVVERDGERAAAIVHDAQLDEDPELLNAAGAVLLLAAENAELDAAWKKSARELADSRARLTQATDQERRKLERDLHDGAQQRLMALQLKLRLAQEHANSQLAQELEEISGDARETLEELRALARGVYPPILRERGVADALRSLAMKAPVSISVDDSGIGRCAGATEAAIYFCALEAIQNTIKHAGAHARVTIMLRRDSGRIHFSVADTGVGMDMDSAAEGMGMTDMRDRIGAVGGEVAVSSSPGQGTCVSGTVPDAYPPGTNARPRG